MSTTKSTPAGDAEPNALYDDDAPESTPLEQQAGAEAPLDDDSQEASELASQAAVGDASEIAPTTAAMARRTSTVPIKQYAVQFGSHRFVIFVEGDICLGTSTGWQKWMAGKSWLSDIRPWLLSDDRNAPDGSRTVFAKRLDDITTPAGREDFPV